MPLLPADERLLHHALELARAAAAFASPNPAVGCVLTRDGRILGEGAHRYDLRDHAEIVALKDAAAHGREVRGATACVTLEPCSHHGRTGPCANALAADGISRCVVATLDPNPLVRGEGLATLRAAHVEVVVAEPASAIAQAARHLNDAFAFSIQHNRPFVTLKAAVSADGKIAPDPSRRTPGIPFWLTGPAARSDVARLRHVSDALMTGIGTVLADDPLLTDRSGQPRRRPLLRVVMDSHLRTPLGSKLVQSAQNDLLLFCNDRADPRRAEALVRQGVEVVSLPAIAPYRGLAAVLEHLQGRHIRSVLTEGGAGLNAVLLRGDLADKVVFYHAAGTLGPGSLDFAAHGGSPASIEAQLTSSERVAFPHDAGEDIRVSGYLHDPWAGI